MPIKDISILDGKQYHIPTTIWKDPRSGNWWLKFSDHILVGYWSSKLFNILSNGANIIQFGGEITNKEKLQHTNTNTGSGRFAQERYQKASYFRNVEIINENDIPQQSVGAYPFMKEKSCYNVNIGNHLVWGTFLYYGGPGRNPNCK